MASQHYVHELII